MVNDTTFEQDLQRFFKDARQGMDVWRRAALILDRYPDRKFNIFHSIFPKEKKKENRISDVFAYLLDPSETHGQGELFLRRFLVDVRTMPNEGGDWLPSSVCSCVRVRREVETSRIKHWERKIDIVITFDDDRAAIAIENKPWMGSTDEAGQLSDYAKHLKRMYEGRFKLIYLTPKRRDPSPNSISCKERKGLVDKGKFANASIQDWVSDNGWLKRAEDEVQAERVRWFVSDFRKALKDSLPEPEEVAEQTNVTPAT